MPREELVLAFPGGVRREEVPPTTHTKGQWLISSLRGLRERGHFDAYLAHLDPAQRRTVLDSVATDWHPMEVMTAHYAACEQLELDAREAVLISRGTTMNAQGSMLGLTARLATSGGVTPWTVLPQFHRFWGRMMRGGGIAVWKLGPKEARVEVAGFAPSRFRYTRLGMCGVIEQAVSLFCTRAYVNEIPGLLPAPDMAARVSWA